MVKKKKKKWLIAAIIIVVLAVIFALTAKKKPQVEYTTVELKKGTMIQTVSEVGTIKANKEMELNFAAAGAVNRIAVKVGELVKKGQILAELDLSSLAIKEKEASSSLEVAAANLNKLLKGATTQDIAIAEAQANQARTSYKAALTDLDKTKALVTENLKQAAKKLADLESADSSNVTPLEQAVSTAQTNLDNVKSNSQQTVNNSRDSLLTTAAAKISSANSALDYVNRLLDDDDLEKVFSVKNYASLNDTKKYYDAAAPLKIEANNALLAAQAEASENNLKSLTAAVLAYLNDVYKTLNSCFSSLENSVVSSVVSQTILDSYKTNISTNLTVVNTGVSAIQTADYTYRDAVLAYKNNVAVATDTLSAAQVNLTDALQSARNAYNSAKLNGESQQTTAEAKAEAAREAWSVADKQLAKIKSPARTEDIALTRAQLDQAQSNLDLIRKQETDSQIIAPIDGQVSKINYEIGEQVGTKAALAMLTENNFEVEVDISEADISKVKMSDQAIITFDAFGEARKFSGSVYSIEPASTIIQDVIYYKVKINLTDAPENLKDLKAGMTANAIITTNRKDDIFMIPARAIVDKNGAGKFVRVLETGDVLREIKVETGLSGNEGMLEINGDGLAEGQKIVTFVKTLK
ncbi:MAG: HlyD family efflux transporter periplasmic adaptor subunit [Patescibacteria group bacterium]